MSLSKAGFPKNMRGLDFQKRIPKKVEKIIYQWTEKGFRHISIFSEKLLRCELSLGVTNLLQWERISEWLADSSQSEQEHPLQLVPRAPSNWQSWTESQALHLPGHLSLLWKQNNPWTSKGVLQTYLVGAKALSGTWEIVIQIPVPKWSREHVGHRKWEWSKGVRSQLQPLRSLRLDSGHLEMRADGQLWSLIQRHNEIKKRTEKEQCYLCWCTCVNPHLLQEDSFLLPIVLLLKWRKEKIYQGGDATKVSLEEDIFMT